MLLLEQMLSPHIGVQNGLDCRSLVSSDFLLDVENSNVLGDGKLSSRKSSQKSRLTNTVLTDQTVSSTVRQSKRGIGQDSLTHTDVQIKVVDLDILGLTGTSHTQIQRVNCEEELVVVLAVLGLSDKLGGLILDLGSVLGSSSSHLSGNLLLSLLELLLVNSRLDLSAANVIQISNTKDVVVEHTGLSVGGVVNGRHESLLIDDLGLGRSAGLIDGLLLKNSKLLEHVVVELLSSRLLNTSSNKQRGDERGLSCQVMLGTDVVLKMSNVASGVVHNHGVYVSRGLGDLSGD